MIDGQIDYSGFTPGQLREALRRIDGELYPLNLANATRELSVCGGSTAAPFTTRLVFTGTGAEYFRIWVVHTLLTLLTLGVYSAWAKVRKERWFAQHTLLLGDPFDYHGRPGRILRGRAIMLTFLIAYSVALDWSPRLTLVTVGLLLVMGPALYKAAQRFRLANTSWRGLRFGFEASTPRVYAVVIPFVLVWTSANLGQWINGSPWFLAAVSGVAALLWPAVHAALKTVQHSSARYGELRFAYEAPSWGFYPVYLSTVLVSILGMIAGGFLLGLIQAAGHATRYETYTTAAAYIAFFALLYIAATPYFIANLQQAVWPRTSAGPLRLGTTIDSQALRGLMMTNGLLVVLTAGLYWPFAAVAIARYRIESITITAQAPLPVISAQRRGGGHALGDAASDLFDLDLGW